MEEAWREVIWRWNDVCERMLWRIVRAGAGRLNWGAGHVNRKEAKLG